MLSRIWDIHEDIVNKVKANGKPWDDLCAIEDENGACTVTGPLQFFSGNRKYYDSVVQSRADLAAALSNTTFPDGTPVNRDQIFGDYEVQSGDKETGEISSIKGTIQFYLIDSSPIATALEWELQFIDHLSGENGGDEVNVYYFANRSLDDELGATITGDILLMIITYLLMIIITCAVVSKRFNGVQSRVGLGFCGVFIVILAMVSDYHYRYKLHSFILCDLLQA